MFRSLVLSAALLSIGLLVNAGSASARTGGTFVPNQGSSAQIKAVASAVNLPQVLAILASPIYTGGNGGDKYSNGDDKNNGYGDGKNNGGSDDHKRPDPTPEPSTILSFGAALVIGGGVLYSRRLRRNRK
jgi:hypothetical protein